MIEASRTVQVDRLIFLRDWAHGPQSAAEHLEMRRWGERSACGTALCLAGKACLEWAPEDVEWLTVEGSDYQQLVPSRPTPDICDVGDLAQELLGLTDDEAEQLFLDGPQSALEYLDTLIEQHGKP